MRPATILVVCLFGVLPSFARQVPSVCGTRPGMWREEQFLHRKAERARLRRGPGMAPRAAAPAALLQDIGNIAILDDSDGVVSRRNQFDLDGRSLAFIPTFGEAARYRYQAAQGGYDDGTAAAGEVLGLDDDDTRAVDLPFAFPYFGKVYRQVWVNSDGNLTFGAGDSSSDDRSLGRLNSGPPRIAPLYEDLDPSRAPQGVRLLRENWRVVVSWVRVPEYELGTPQTFQVSLYTDGRIEFAWQGTNPQAAVVGISTGGILSTPTLVALAEDASAEYSGTVAERFGNNLEIDVTTAAQKFYRNHEDAYDYLVFFNDLDVPVGDSAVAYELTLRNQRSGYGDVPVDVGAEYGSPARLQAVMNMGPLSQYPASPTALVSARGTVGDTPVSVLAHEAGHLFLAYASVRDPNDPQARPMLGGQNAHWGFVFNSEASLLEGNRIQDKGVDQNPRFLTTGTVEAFSPLDQYLMGFRSAAEVEPEHRLFYVLPSQAGFYKQRLPQKGVSISGDRRDVGMDELVGVLGRRTPDHTVAQRRFRFAFVLIVAEGARPTAAALDKLETFRAAFEQFYGQAAGNRAVADTSLKLNLRLSLSPAAGVMAGRAGNGTVSVDTPPAAPLVVVLNRPNGVIEAPATVTIPVGVTSAAFSFTGVRAGVEELLATPNDNRYHAAAARVQVAAPADLRVELVSREPLVVRVTDINELPYPGVRLAAAASGGGNVTPTAAVTDAAGRAIFQWSGAGQLRVSVEGAADLGLTLTASGVLPQVRSLVNAASFEARLAPGTLATIFGTQLTAGARAEAPLPWPVMLAGIQVLLNGVPVPLTYVSDSQINFLIPPDATPGAATVVVANARGNSPAAPVTLAALAPAIFDNGFGREGDVLQVYCTGMGTAGLTPVVTVGGREATVLRHGLVEGYQGLYRVDVQLPPDLPPGPQTVTLSVGGVSAGPRQVVI